MLLSLSRSFWDFLYPELRDSHLLCPIHLHFHLVISLRFCFPQGAFYPVESLVDPPFLPAPFELPQRRDSMLYIGISEYFFKSASFAHYVSGALGAMLSTKEVSKALRWGLWPPSLIIFLVSVSL